MSGRLRATARTLGALGLLGAALPASLALTGAALVARTVLPDPYGADRPADGPPRTVLLSGGKMTKALALARAFRRAGHRVVLVETARYKHGGHRASRAVDAFHVVPDATDPGYAAALLDIVRREQVDVYVPVCSPASSVPDARAAALLAPHCEVLHVDADVIETLDDKHAFAAAAAAMGLDVPDTHRITDPQQVLDFPFPDDGTRYILKSIPYDPVHRLDLTPLPRPTPEETRAFVERLPIAPDRPWILQELVEGREYCTHATVREGEVRVWACCESSPFQVNYAMAEHPGIRDWVTRFAKALELTGQVSMDFIVRDDGRAVAIECNPRTHSAITMFHGHPDLAAAYLDPDGPSITPLPGSRPTWWAAHELWRALRHPTRVGERLGVVLRGRDAVFDVHDPLPFLLLHHRQLPLLLLGSLRAGRAWVRIDANIGKLVEPAGD